MSYTSENSFGSYILADRRMWVEFTDNPASKTLIDLQKNIYNCKGCDNKREKALLTKEKEMKKLLTERTFIPELNKFPRFGYVHYHIPFSKLPIATLGTIFFPLWLLGVINLAIFYQDSNLADRIANIATLMIAFIGLIPMIREEVPPNPKFTAI